MRAPLIRWPIVRWLVLGSLLSRVHPFRHQWPPVPPPPAAHLRLPWQPSLGFRSLPIASTFFSYLASSLVPFQVPIPFFLVFFGEALFVFIKKSAFLLMYFFGSLNGIESRVQVMSFDWTNQFCWTFCFGGCIIRLVCLKGVWIYNIVSVCWSLVFFSFFFLLYACFFCRKTTVLVSMHVILGL